MNKGIFIIVFTFVTVHKTLDSNLKAFCVSNVYFFDSSYRKNFKFQLRFLVQTSINLHVPKDASLALNIPLMGGGKFSSSQAVMMHRSIRIFYFNYYSLIKDLYGKFRQFLRETFQDLQIAILPFNTVFLLNIIFINSVTPQVISGSQYNERKMVFYMTCSDAGDARVVPTHLPFPSREQL